MAVLAAETEQSGLALFEGGGRPLSSLDPARIRSAIEDQGAVLVRGYSVTIADFAALGAELCSASLFNESPNREILGGPDVQSVNLGNDPFPLHPEVAREPWRPDLAMFSCIGVPRVGGQTNL